MAKMLKQQNMSVKGYSSALRVKNHKPSFVLRFIWTIFSDIGQQLKGSNLSDSDDFKFALSTFH